MPAERDRCFSQTFKANNQNIINIDNGGSSLMPEEIAFMRRQRKQQREELPDKIINHQKEKYISTPLPFPSWMPCSNSVEKNFIPITFRNNQQQHSNGARAIQMEHLVSEICSSGEAMIVEGKQGYGKTTFTLKLISDWANNKCKLSEFKVVLHVKDSQESCMLDDICAQLEGLFAESLVGLPDIVKFINKPASQILVLVDGIENSSEKIQREILVEMQHSPNSEENQTRTKKNEFKKLITICDQPQSEILERIASGKQFIIEGIQEDHILEFDEKSIKTKKQIILNKILNSVSLSQLNSCCPQLKMGLRFLLKDCPENSGFNQGMAFLVAYYFTRQEIQKDISQIISPAHIAYFLQLYELASEWSTEKLTSNSVHRWKIRLSEDMLYLRSLFKPYETETSNSNAPGINVEALMQLLYSCCLAFWYVTDTERFFNEFQKVLRKCNIENVVFPFLLSILGSKANDNILSILEVRNEYCLHYYYACKLMGTEKDIIQFSPLLFELPLASDGAIRLILENEFYLEFEKQFFEPNRIRKLIVTQQKGLGKKKRRNSLSEYIPFDGNEFVFSVSCNRKQLPNLKRELSNNHTLNDILNLSELANRSITDFCKCLEKVEIDSLSIIEKDQKENLQVTVCEKCNTVQALVTVCKSIGQKELTSVITAVGKSTSIQDFSLACKADVEKHVDLSSLCNHGEKRWNSVELHNCNIVVSQADHLLDIKSLSLKGKCFEQNAKGFTNALQLCSAMEDLTLDGCCLSYILNNAPNWQSLETLKTLQVHDTDISQCSRYLFRMNSVEKFCWTCSNTTPVTSNTNSLIQNQWLDIFNEKNYRWIELKQGLNEVNPFVAEMKAITDAMIERNGNFLPETLSIILTKEWKLCDFQFFLENIGGNLKAALQKQIIRFLKIKLLNYRKWYEPPFHYLYMKNFFPEFKLCFTSDVGLVDDSCQIEVEQC